MLKRITFNFAALMLLIVFVGTTYAWRPTGGRNYGNFEKLDQKTYNYNIVFYENINGEVASWINTDSTTRFPLTVKDTDGTLKTYNTKSEFINDIVIPAMNEFNNKISGYAFNHSGMNYGSSSSVYGQNDGISAIQIYRQSSGDGGGSAWWGLGYDEFGYKLYVGDPDTPTLSNVSSKQWNIFALRHEFIHCLFFSHKKEDLFGSTHTSNPFYSYHRLGCNLTDGTGNNFFRELNEDSMAGIDEVYNTTSYNLTLQGYVSDEYSTGYAEACLVDDSTHKIIYQAKIDTTGFYRFRLIYTNFPSTFRVLVANNKINEAYYGDHVRYNSVGYLCTSDHINQQPPNSTYWTVVNPMGGINAIANSNNWDSTTNYKARQAIKWNYSSVYSKPSPGTYSLSSMSMNRTANSLADVESVSGIQMLYSYVN